MGQLLYAQNFNNVPNASMTYAKGSLLFFGFNIYESISFKTANMVISGNANSNGDVSISLGLYSLNSSTLSLANSISRGITRPSWDNPIYISLSDTSANQNISPGTWYWGLVISGTTTAQNVTRLIGQQNIDPLNAFPGGFIGGRMTDTTNALPVSYETSNLDITGSDAMPVPVIILTA